jgi:hypothetical protein
MSGLSDVYSTNIVANSVEVLDEFIVDDGATITLPANSIQDSYLSTNVALLNRTPQTFTGVNTFNANTTQALGTFFNCEAPSGGTISRLQQTTTGLIISNVNVSQNITLRTRTAANTLTIGFQCQNGNTAFMQGDLNNRITITGATTPTISTQAPALSDDLSIANTSWINTKLTAYPTLAGNNTFTGSNTFNTGTTTFNALTVHNATLRSFQSIQAVFPGDLRVVDSTQTYLTQMYQSGTTCAIDGNFASSRIQITTRNASSVAVNNLVMENNNHVVLQGSASEIDILGTAITINGSTSFKNNVNIGLYNFDITNAAKTRGIRFSNNGANNGITDINGIGVSTRYNFYTNDSSGVTTQNLWIGNGNNAVIQGASGLGIEFSGSAIEVAGICSFTNTTTPVITQSIALADNSTKISTTAFVKGQGYALTSDLANYGLLAGANTWTGTTNTFSNASLGNQISIQSTANSGPSTISQVTNSLVISAVTDNTGAYQSTLTLSSRTATNTGCVLFTGNSTTITIGQNSTNTNISSTNLTMSSVCSFTNTTTPTITQAIALSDNSTKIATTAFVKGQAYAELTPTANPQIFTGNQKFQNSGANLPISLANTTAGVTSSGGLFIANNSGSYNASVIINDTVLLSTGTGNGTGSLTLTTWSNTPVGLRISPTSSTFIGSVNVPTQLTTDNSTLAASTAYVKNQGYALNTDLTAYALLTPSANPQIFTGQQRFQSTTANLPISVASTTGGVTGAGGLFVATSAGQYNPIVKGNDLVLVGTGSAIDSASTKLTLTTNATSSVGIQMDIGNMTFDGGIIRQNSPFNCGYSYLATPLTVKGFYDIGYVWTIPYASFTGGAWATSTAIYNILTLAWDGTGNTRLGVWKVDVVIINTCTSAPSSSLCWNTISNVNRTINDTCVGASDLFLFGATGCQIMRMSFTINVVNLTTTYYLNSLTGGGAGLASNTASQITFTRLA